ncbi:MAG: His-Xaa-Ser system protein HxsD [Candidatus Falkowbacteria bacterium]
MNKNNIIKIRLNAKLYPKEAIFGAAYVFIDRVYVFLDAPKPDVIDVSLESKSGASAKGMEKLRGEFQNELLNYVHRINLAKFNKKIREYIVERALYSSVEKESQLSEAVFDDPLGIAVPWEEKYGTESKK